MYLEEHSVVKFRNIESIIFTPNNGVNVVFGQNGQGKTNLLESIFLLTGAKSFRARKDSELIKTGEDYCVIDSLFFLEQRQQRIKITVSDKGRTAQRNRGSEVKAASLVGIFCCVLFSPEHLMLIKGSPEQRRRFIDTALCQISPKYLIELKRYTRIVQQKNSTLKNAHRTGNIDEILDVYDAQLSEAARVVTYMRRNFCDSLILPAKEDYFSISGKNEELDFKYLSSMFKKEEMTAGEGYEILLKNRESDIRSGFSSIGPHRDDLSVTIDGVNARTYSSQGQQRTAVLALKLAESSVMEKALGEKPVLLLDDVLSELDGCRQDFLMGRLLDGQAIITSCDPLLISSRVNSSLFEMKDGRLTNHL